MALSLPVVRPRLAPALGLALAAALAASGRAPRALAEEPKATDPVPALLERMKDAASADDRLGAVVEAISLDDARLLPPLVKRLKDAEEPVRLAAVSALGARSSADGKRRAATALLERSKVLTQAAERDVTVRDELLAVLRALHDLAQEATIDGVLDGIETGVDLEVVEARAMAVANVPAPRAIERLIDYMARKHRDGSGMRGRLSKALTYATGVKLANDPDAWRAWWRSAKTAFDFERAAAERKKQREARDEATARKEEQRAKRKKAEETPKDTPKDPPKDRDGAPSGDGAGRDA